MLAEGSVGVDGKELNSFKIRQVLSGVDRLQIVGVRPRPAQLTLDALQSKGFFVTPDGRRLFGNEGEVKALTDDGVVYTLYFGEVTLDSGLALTAGPSATRTRRGPRPRGRGKEQDANRYMFVNVAYDPGADNTAAAAEGAEPEGAKRAEPLQARFDKWFYVISDASFNQIRKPKAEFFKDQAPGSGPTAPVVPPASPATKKPAPAKPAAK